MPELPPQYNPQAVEENRYQWWEAQGLFAADVPFDRAASRAKAEGRSRGTAPSRTPYTIVIPPPNVTGILHMGHALNNTIQDILIRAKRMQGFNALWVPGTDHAGIATQNVVEKSLAKEGKKRQDLGREAFIKRVWEWKEQYGNTILYQLRRLGSSCDWRRTRFTMDEGLSEAVAEIFTRLYEEGLIYRGHYIINWCPRCQTALADEEAPRQQTQGKLYHIRYPLEKPSKKSSAKTKVPEFIEVATTRPETMLGDTAIAVHPKDKRYKHLVGGFAILPLVGRRIPIIADEMVDREFGTGAVKVTPAHDPADFMMGKKHKLEFINVMTDDAHMTNVPKAYEGLDRYECRSKLTVDLEQAGFLGAIDEHTHNVGHCYRCNTAVEPRLSPQWFVKMKPLATPAIKAVKTGKLKFSPERWTKVYLNWMENIEDWCISRQIWWGHRIPVYYCGKCQEQAKPTKTNPQPGVIVSKTKPDKCPSCGNKELRQEEDVLDTWFSSWLWPFSTLGWPKKTPDLDYFYPTSTLVTAQEIIFFWVARMVMAGYFCMKESPFSTVYIHGTVRDITGKKMSKSLGNIIDPLDIIKQYGTDALRYTLITATAIGQDVFLSEERFLAGRNFANKLWNATRFLLSQGPVPPIEPKPVTAADRWILSKLQRSIEATTQALDAMLFNEAATTLYDFLWHDFCDWYIEIAKIETSQKPENRDQKSVILAHVLEVAMRLLHPIMPFVTEELWQQLKPKESPASIMVAAWPTADKKRIDAEAERQFGSFQAVVTAIRTTRATLNIANDQEIPVVVLASKDKDTRDFFNHYNGVLQALTQVSTVGAVEYFHKQNDAIIDVVDGVEVAIPLGGFIDAAKKEKEVTKMTQRVTELSRWLENTDKRLNDPNFTNKAPADVIEQTRLQRAQNQETLKKLNEYLSILQSM